MNVSIQQLRVTDADALGHVSAPRLLDLLINAHYELLAHDGWVICRQDLTYRRPVPRTELTLAVTTRPTRIGHTSLVLASQLTHPTHQAALYLDSTTVWVHTNPATGQPAPLPAQLRTRLEPLTAQARA